MRTGLHVGSIQGTRATQMTGRSPDIRSVTFTFSFTFSFTAVVGKAVNENVNAGKSTLSQRGGASSSGSTENVCAGPIGVTVVPTIFPIAAR